MFWRYMPKVSALILTQCKKCDTWFEMTNSLKVYLSRFTETHIANQVSEKKHIHSGGILSS